MQGIVQPHLTTRGYDFFLNWGNHLGIVQQAMELMTPVSDIPQEWDDIGASLSCSAMGLWGGGWRWSSLNVPKMPNRGQHVVRIALW